ncbi:MAG: Fe-S cluster assembly protein SufD [Bacteroidota bacterium]
MNKTKHPVDSRKQIHSIKDYFVSDFERHKDEILGNSSANIREIREKAIVSFEKLGIPAGKNEEWKYSNVKKILGNDYVQALTTVDSSLTARDIKPFLIHRLDACIVVVENGRFIKKVSTGMLGSGITICGFSQAIKSNFKIAEKYFSNYADIDSDAFIALNTAFALDGVFIFIPDGKILTKPIHIINIINTVENLFIQPRNLFVIGASSSVQIIESFYCTALKENNDVFTNAVTEIICGGNSNVDHYTVQNKNGCRDAIHRVSTTQVLQEANSVFSANTITLNGSFIRNNLNIVHDAEGCETHLYGLSFLKNKQHVDNHTLVDHKKPGCYSNELYINIMDDESTGVFDGKVLVRENAQKTNANQSNKNILLSDEASVNAKPQLEIYADDVKCSHGATTGQLDREALFYLRSRGIEEEKARGMLIYAFASEVIKNIKIEPLRRKIGELISKRLRT